MTGILALILFVLILVVGGDRGAVSVMALTGNIAILSLATMLLAGGHSPLLITFLAGGIISYITLIKQNGKNAKTVSAFLATAIVMLGLIAVIYVVVWSSESGGLNEIQAIQEDVMYYYNVDIHINMIHIAACICLLSTLGAVLDTTLAVTSSAYEVAVHNPEMSRGELYHLGLQIGKEIIGTTVNTLLFAYLGESILLFAYLKIGKFTLETIINSKFLFQGVSVMLFGGIACLLAVPTAAACIAFRQRSELNAAK
ncbi:MAG: YibE/F family protein [Muricomes sp.]